MRIRKIKFELLLNFGELLLAGQTVFGFTISLRVTPSMSESFDVVVFHVLEDGETVADRAHVQVLQCFDNQV